MGNEPVPSGKMSLDFSDLLPDIETQMLLLPDSLWLEHVNRKGYSGSWSVVPIRVSKKHEHANPLLQGFAIENDDQWIDLPIIKELPSIKSIFSTLMCSIKSARLMRLAPSAYIAPHRDSKLSLENGEARLHISLQTNDKVDFISQNKRLDMQAGELWYINAEQEHSVRNTGNKSRINLVMDCVANDWIRDHLCSWKTMS